MDSIAVGQNYYPGKPFTPADFPYNTTTSTLENPKYANKYKVNYFFQSNYFQDVAVTSLNGIADSVIDFISNLTSDAQQQFIDLRIYIDEQISTLRTYVDDEINTLRNYVNDAVETIYNYIAEVLIRFQNYKYDVGSGKQSIDGHTTFNTSNLNDVISVNCNTINFSCSRATTQFLTATQRVEAPNLFNGMLSYDRFIFPITSDGALVSSLGDLVTEFFNGTAVYVSLSPGYTIRMLDSKQIVLFSLTNGGKSWMHYSKISFNPIFTPYRIELVPN